MNDEGVLNKIEQLVAEEHTLLGVDEAHRAPEHHERLTAVEVELDRCWDLLNGGGLSAVTASAGGRVEENQSSS
jgi:hypothetical protein